MQGVQQKLGTQLKEVQGEQLQEMGEWLMCIDPASGKPNGKIKVRAGSSSQVRLLEEIVGRLDVVISGNSVPISVSNFHAMALPQCLGNC